MTKSNAHPQQYLQQSELIYNASAVNAAIDDLAERIKAMLAGSNPLVLCVMGGAVVFVGQLLPKLSFPLEFDYVQASRYHNQTEGQHLVWKMLPRDNVRGRTVLVL